MSVPGGPWKSIHASPPSNAGTGRLRRELGSDDAEPEQAVDLVRHPPDDPVGIRRHDRVACPGADLEQQVVAAEHPRAALAVGLGGGEDDPVPRARHRVDQPDVVALRTSTAR